MRTLSSVIAILAAALSAQQGPDIINPSGHLDGLYAFVDRNKDGKYTADGECWDFRLDGVNTSPQATVYLASQKRWFWCDPTRDAVMTGKDANNNGILEDSEVKKWFDVRAHAGSTNEGPRFCTLAKNDWLWWTNTTGVKEGLFRSRDLNNDGDAEDTGETVEVIVEGMSAALIPNIANSTSKPKLPLTGLDTILYDPRGLGRFLLEEEATDSTIALEDKNADGDFLDAGECYLVLMMWSRGALVADQNPDVKSNLLPVTDENRIHIVDRALNTFYIMSCDTTAANTDAGLVYVCKDGNNDGDFNDTGETKIFWDGSLDSKGANKGYNFCVSGNARAFGGVVYITAEFDGAVDDEHLLRLQDKNNDGDANDAGEVTVLWKLGADKTHYHPVVLPAGTLATPAGLPATSAHFGKATCRSSLGATATHNIQYGTDPSNLHAVLGKTWGLRTWGATANANGAYSIGLTQIPNGVALDGGGTCFAYQSFDLIGLRFTTSTTGTHDTLLPVPSLASLVGLSFSMQSIVVDATAPGGLGITLSNGLAARAGRYSYTNFH